MMATLLRNYHSTSLALVLGVLCLPAVSSATLITSFEAGDLDGWNAPDVNEAPTSVTANRASDGVYSTESSFTVPAEWAGWGVHTLLSKDSAAIGISSSTTEITLDAYSDWTNPNEWGVYGNNIWLILNYEGTWATIEPSSGALTNGTFTTLTYDIGGHAAAMTAPDLSYSVVEVAWFLGTWADDGQDNGVHTISIDNINGDNLSAIPEPASLLLMASSVLALCAICRRRKP